MANKQGQAKQAATEIVLSSDEHELEQHRERSRNLHLFLSSYKYLNDAVTISQVLEHWKTNDEKLGIEAPSPRLTTCDMG